MDAPVRRRFESPVEAPKHPARFSRSVIASLLTRLAKHLSLLSCLLIVGGATGRSITIEVGIFLLVAAATLIYSIGRSLERRSTALASLPRNDP
ncbi:MAG TPA: hypothetical protein VMT22_04990 [Terriglobales bacterium]|nr:hypothetical protein [Terriglobales bacterium]